MRVDLNKLRNLAEAVRQRTEASAADRGRHSGRSWYRIENAAAADRAEVFIFDMIGEWGVSAQDFVNELRGLKARSLDVRISSEGGEVFDGLAIYEALRQHNADVTVYVDGLAASAASFIAMAGDKVVMAQRARMMIHDAHGLCIGNSRDMRELAALLDDLSDNIADIYAERAGGTRQQWRDAMRGNDQSSDGTWYDAEAAVQAGLADEVSDSAKRRKAKFDEDAHDAIDVATVTDTGGDQLVFAGFDPAALLGTFAEIEAPPPPPLPDGQALLNMFKTS